MSERTSYDLGWSDGYCEGYGCKLADATEPFNPQSLARPEAVEAAARYLRSKHSVYFASPDDALGCARGILKAIETPEHSRENPNG